MTTTDTRSCDWCGNKYDPEIAKLDGHQEVDFICMPCQDDSSWCNDCNHLYPSEDIRWSDCTPICESCCNRNYHWCDPCGEYWHHQYPCDHQEWGSEEFDGRIIHDYSYQPELKWFVRDIDTNTIVKTNRIDFRTSTPFMGFELEIEVERDRFDIGSELLDNIGKWAYLKHDGSLDNGFEIVTHPHTLSAYNLRNWDWIDWLKSKNASSWDTNTCGLHIHINKSAFVNNGHIWRFTNLVLYNRNQSARLAGRRDNRWASFAREYKQVGKILKGDQDPHRYSAVNLCPYRTIEVRMFRGSLHEPRLRSALEFVNANFEYTKPLTSHDVLKNDALNWWSFTKWVQSNESTYPHLNHYLTKIKERSQVDVSTML